jgi:hypothetical protein
LIHFPNSSTPIIVIFINIVFKIESIQILPYVLLDFDHSNKTHILSGGYEGKLIQTMSKHFNFTYELIICNNDWGTQMPNKTWTGIIGKIVSEVYSEIYFFFLPRIFDFTSNC